jgi:uncharacterized protein YndB with AHSA1/START domain
MDTETMVERSVDLDAPVEDVWSAITDEHAISEWFGGPATLDPVPGGAGRFESDGEVRHARVHDVDPGRRLSWRWWTDGDDDGPITAVTFELTPLPVGTRLVVTEQTLLPGVPRASASVLGTGLRGLQLSLQRSVRLAPERGLARSVRG